MTKHRVHPHSPGDLVCPCGTRYPESSDREATVQRARAAEWHVYKGPSLTGEQIERIFCPRCFNLGGSARPNRNTVMEGQLDLLEGFGDELRGRSDQVPGRGKRGGKGRQLA